MKYSVSGRVSCAGGGRVCVVEQSDLRCPRLLTRTAAAPSRAHGNQLCSDRMREVSWMKYDFKAHSEMGKYHITGIEFTVCLHALKIHGFIMQQLWCISQNFSVYRCGLFVTACINITRPRRCSSFSFFFPLNSVGRMDYCGLICLPRLLSGSTAKHRVNCVSVLCGIMSNLKDWGNRIYFPFFSPHYQSRDVAFSIHLWLSQWCH